MPVKTLIFHVRRMAKDALASTQLLAAVLEATDVKAVGGLLAEAQRRQTEGWTPDPEALRREAEALELKRWREQTRKRFEERMIRKAKREGRGDDYYLKQGAEVPTAAAVAELKAMGHDAAFGVWKKRHGQHCWALHMEPAGCTRERTCAFLHVDVAASEDPAWHG